MAHRGELTDAVKEVSREHLGYEIDQIELRLMPYIQFVMMNERRIERDKIAPYEKATLQKWEDLGFISAIMSHVTVTKEFWDAINQIAWFAYVDHENQTLTTTGGKQ